MLRRVKRDVESEMAPKVEKTIYCEMSSKQRSLYNGIKQMFNKSADEKSSNGIESVLANYVMQLRKVCNHPDIFQRQETISPLQFQQPVSMKTLLPKEITGYHPEVFLYSPLANIYR
jgi:DNA helicase INO80